MDNFIRNFLTEWRRLDLPFEDATFVAAVSGGADSVSLLLALYELKKLKKLNLRFAIAHYNHDLRGEESEKDEQFVKNLASEFGFELALGRGKISQEGNLEQNARIARYAFLTQTAENLHANGILTAHTLNDNAETFLMNLIRGSGIEGLGGMKVIRFLEEEKRRKGEKENALIASSISSSPHLPFSSSKILLIRPLLTWAKREDTENYCHLNNVEYRYDSMNENLAFKRVRIRKVLLPLLEDFNPKIIETLAKTAFLLQEDFAELREIAERQCASTGNELLLKDIKNLSISTRQNILREWLKNNRGNLRSLDTKHFEAIENLIFSQKSGKTIELPNRETVVKEDGRLLFKKLKVEKSPSENYNQE
ncbi:MAG: tRNA lysidine(34) synthetase TilS [Pyrinomonadaceae bacterium]